ncbi:Flotillin family [Trema orientale]|uniref:Flotillin-like n=1 Tax=Trema orientale TaxID=63057 RepID=A0A2P5ACW4_TREOI|nr:Flotillin family [Trema orientale]
MYRYHVARPHEYLAITSLGINDMKLCKDAYIWPLFQKCIRIYVFPTICTFRVMAKSADDVTFIMTTSFEMGPRVDDKIALLLYAKLVYPCEKISLHNHAHKRVYDVIKVDIRAIASLMTIEEICKDFEAFKEKILHKIELQLIQFGLVVLKVVDVKKRVLEKIELEALRREMKEVCKRRVRGHVPGSLCYNC